MKKMILIVLFMSIVGIIYADFFLNNRKGDWQNPGITINTIGVTKIINLLDYPDANNTGLITADNHLAVQAAIEDRELYGITIIEFPAGEYWFNAPIDISNSNIVLSGEGSTNTILKWNQISDNCINVSGIPGSDLNQDGGPFNEDAEPIYNVGIENMTLDFALEGTPSGYTGNIINLYFAKDCWIRGIESIKPVRHHILLRYCENITVSGSYFHGAWDVGPNGFGYGVQVMLYTRKCLIENNIFSGLRHAMTLNDGANNNVFSYNYSRNVNCSPEYLYVDDYTADCCVHGANEDDPDIWGILPPGPEKNLFEGNDCVQMIADNAHDPNGSLNTFFRNKVRKYGIHVATQDPSQNIVSNWIQEGCSLEVLEFLFNTFQGYPGGILGVPFDCYQFANQIEDEGPPYGNYCFDFSLYTGLYRPSFFPEEMLWPPFGASEYSSLGHGNIPAKFRWEETIKTILYGLPNYNYDVCIVSGNVSLNGGSGEIEDVLITFDPISGSNVEVIPSSDGSFSRVFSFDELGTYDITYKLFSVDGDYYPITIEDVVIDETTAPLTLDDIVLQPISDPSDIKVSSTESIPAFRNIQDGLDYIMYKGIDGSITIYPGIYAGDNLGWDTDISHIKVSGYNQNESIIEGEYVLFLLIGSNCNENDIIENLTLRNCNNAIVNMSGVSIIRNNKFENCNSTAVANYSPIKLQNNIFVNNSYNCLWFEGDFDNTVHSEIEDNVFMQNTSTVPLLYIDEMGYIDIRNNTFIDNTFDLDNDYEGSVIEFHTTEDSRSVYIEGNIFQNNNDVSSTNGSILSIDNNDPPNDINLSNNTFIENSADAMINYSTVNTQKTNYNSIFKSNTIYGDNVINGEFLYCDYSLFYDNNADNGNCSFGDNNILEENPLLSINNIPLWNSTSKSPCIDIGNGSNDPDGTPADIGAIPAVIHKYDEISLPPPSVDNGWKWLSFPALDNVYSTANYDPDVPHYLLANILDPSILDIVETEGNLNNIAFLNPGWSNEYEQFYRTEGFKFHMNDDFTLEVPGFKEYDNTTIVLDGGIPEGNWIGYWLEETQLVSDAFSDYWDASNIYFIHHQNWTAFYLGRWRIQLYSGTEPTLSYGDMVIVKCYNTINNFQWNNGAPTIRTLIAETEYFTYEEQADYTPLYIELDSGNMPQEIGAFVNGECIGATVVSDTLTQINAYTTSVPPGDIELELYYGNRSENKHISSYNCITSSNPNITMKQLSTKDKDDAWFIDLREDSEIIPEIVEFSASNYPNPFNPTTTISYSLPLEGKISLNIYNIKGQLVKQLIDGNQPEGYYKVVWNGKDNNEKSVSSGIYFYKLSTRDETIMKKMLMLK